MITIQSIALKIRPYKRVKISLMLGWFWFVCQTSAGVMRWPEGMVMFMSRAQANEPVKTEGDVENKDHITEEEGRYLLRVARNTIEKALFDQAAELEEEPTSKKYYEQRGTFVTLTCRGNLRGCIGHIIPHESLIEGIRINAINAAFRDPRFPRLDKKEWPKIKIEISILTEPQPLPYRDADDLLQKIRPGIDGLILKKGYRQATFLPQVWEQVPDKKEFLTHLCLKAGLDPHAWKNEKLEVSTYQVQAFEEH